MRHLLLFLYLLCLTSLVAYAQTPNPIAEVQEVPELKKLWQTPEGFVNSWREGDGLCYLPNFIGSKGVIPIRTADNQIRSYYPEDLANPVDSTNRFTWFEWGRAPYTPIDINNDGISDYVDDNGRIYKGIKNGAPPDSMPLQNVRGQSENQRIIYDLNKDGFNDIVDAFGAATRKDTSLTVVFGAETFDKMYSRRYVGKPADTSKPNPWNGLDAVQKLYKSPDGKLMLITIQIDGGVVNAYRLFELTWDSQLQQILVTKKHEVYIGDVKWFSGIEIYVSPSGKNIFAFFMESEDVDLKKTFVRVYNLGANSFWELRRIPNIYGVYSLQHSVDGDTIPDIFLSQPNSAGQKMLLIKGGEALDFSPIAYFPHNVSVVSIDDVNGDGINDLAMGWFREDIDDSKIAAIVSGAPIISSIYSHPQNSTMATYPNPVSTNSILKLRVASENTSFKLSLFEIVSNRAITTQEVLSNNGVIEFNLSPYSLASGSYTIALQQQSEIQHIQFIVN